MYGAIDISVSALTAYRTQLDVAAGNIAMKDAVRWDNGEAIPYRRRVALLSAGVPARGEKGRADAIAPGVHVSAVVEDPTPFPLRFDPHHPHAIQSGEQKGYVRLSNVDYHTEMVNAIVAARAYEANVTVIETAKSIAAGSLRLIA